MTRYNPSLATGNSARRAASNRTPVRFWLDVPVYLYVLPCSLPNEQHAFLSRTPATGATQLWCNVCGTYRAVPTDLKPVGRQHETDEQISRQQDLGVMRERIARAMSATGIPESDADVASIAAQYGVSTKEVRFISAGLNVTATVTVATCRKGLHPMTFENVTMINGKPRCKACRTEGQRARRHTRKDLAA